MNALVDNDKFCCILIESVDKITSMMVLRRG